MYYAVETISDYLPDDQNYFRSPYPMEDHSEYQYAVVLGRQESNHESSFLNIEDMLFEVFRSEESNTIDSIALGQFVVALENTGLRR